MRMMNLVQMKGDYWVKCSMTMEQSKETILMIMKAIIKVIMEMKETRMETGKHNSKTMKMMNSMKTMIIMKMMKLAIAKLKTMSK